MPQIQKSQDQKTKMPQSNAKSPQKETQKKKEDKQLVLEKLVKSQPKVDQNEQKTITDAKQETKPILTKAQKKKLQMEYQKQFIQQQRTKEDIKAAKPQEIANPSGNIPRNQEFAKTCNHHQAMPIQRNNLPCKPKGTTSKEKLIYIYIYTGESKPPTITPYLLKCLSTVRNFVVTKLMLTYAIQLNVLIKCQYHQLI
ncbi:Hypothetical_protein [Hexamita inflata]|uniref:Hypothetical_protein n=1 Tax=Hexamita inflata TaxID=28002 RepID=A0AA86UCH3_9EUKA|nr:Hypothetical protein HINF_LOCUS40215 [Hexamita inflata]